MRIQLAPGSTLSHYTISSQIGAGGMGDVYLAEDNRLGRKLALKLLPSDLAADKEKLSRFIREARSASGLNHPNILTVYDIGEAEGHHYIATELIDGMTLRDHLTREKLTLDEAIRISMQVSEALAAAHKAGMIHRDIKPENIMLRSDGYAKVLDFGLAKLVERDEPGQFETTPGLVMGTVSYMSPEQARGQTLDPRTDVFSLGAVMYEMLTGRQAYAGDSNSDILVAILQKDPDPLPPSDDPLAIRFHSIIHRAISKDRARRYVDAGEVASALKELQNSARTGSLDVEANTQAMAALPAAQMNTIAVLPFVNMTRNENGDYLSDGLAEELLNVLSKINGLRVAARTSAFTFKDRKATVSEIGNTLNVASILDGSIRTAGNRVRISVQLIKVEDGYTLWSESYDRGMDDLFAMQDDIAQSVVEELREHFFGEMPGENTTRKVIDEVALAVRGRAGDPEAQRLMLLGRFFLDRTTRADTEKAIGYFRQALDIDPGFALGWAELARAFAVQAGKSWAPVDEGYAAARKATENALELEPELPEAHALMGRIRSAYDWDMKGARLAYERALRNAPGNPVVMDGSSVLELKLGHLDTALEMSRKVLAQDPLSGAVWHNLGLICHAAGRLDEAETAMRRALELIERRTVTAAMLALIIFDQGRTEDAFEAVEKEPDRFWRLWATTIMLYSAGRSEEADLALKDLLSESTPGDAYQMAEVYGARGDQESAFEWLEKALAERDPGVTHAKASPRLRSLHSDARWPGFLARVGLV